MTRLALLASILMLPMISLAAIHCGVVKKIEKNKDFPQIQFEDGVTVKIYDNWTEISIATTAFATKARLCVEERGYISIEQ